MKDCVFIFTPSYQTYQFHQDHPFNQLRVYVTYDLLNTMNAFAKGEIIAPRMASESELSLVHTSDYIKAVKLAGAGKLPAADGEGYGLGTEDTPVFAGMHEAASLFGGRDIDGCRLCHDRHGKTRPQSRRRASPRIQRRASGFCIYNDSSVVIRYLQKNYHARVLYIDTDAHHGDGVQFTFYDDPSVCTVSIHETGRYLFPGTGQVQERGHGEGYGYAFNIPLDAFTEDQSFIDSYRTAVTEIAEFFKPDVILTQNGADAHFYDPLTHLCTTMRIYEEIPKLAHELAHKYCDGRWIAVGGGGYDIWRVVPGRGGESGLK